ncbi:MAG: hypothetical protein WA463_15135 [Terriglobales bacterium]
MANEATGSGAPFDPMSAFRQMRDAYLDVWAKTMVDTVNTEAYAAATGKMLDTYLAMSSPFREAVEKGLLQALEQLNLPSRVDFMGLAERLTNVEMRLDDMDAKLDRIEGLLSKPASAPRRRAAAAATRANQSRQASRRKRTK